ncbi:contractile injection system protein, VgrG/Pvc8 family [Marinimicrobium sp. ARAG 43.8]|uniref:contractile injection system protein, VgrG/Pvc8 family n=1 Tax=Marinimicrobium sp. ARAG 43.8 TaxID=3418719 RepID=UPI003CFB83E0
MNPYPHAAPRYRLVVNGEDITPTVNGRLISLAITENSGDEADTMNLILSDHDNQLGIPPHGAEIQVAIGWEGEPLIDKGLFTVDETEHSGPPDQLTIRARSANLRDDLPGKKSRSWYRVTIGELVQEIAAEHGLKAVVSPRLSGVRLPSPQQTAESDLNFLTRIGKPYDALVSVKENRLLFIPKAQATTLSGADLPPVTIQRRDTDQHRYSHIERDAYTGVRAKWNDIDGGRYEWVVAGSPEKATELPETFATEHDAMTAATAEWARLERGKATLNLTLARGEAALQVETPLRLQGWKDDIDAKWWIVLRVDHRLMESGFNSSVESETK